MDNQNVLHAKICDADEKTRLLLANHYPQFSRDHQLTLWRYTIRQLIDEHPELIAKEPTSLYWFLRLPPLQTMDGFVTYDMVCKSIAALEDLFPQVRDLIQMLYPKRKETDQKYFDCIYSLDKVLTCLGKRVLIGHTVDDDKLKAFITTILFRVIPYYYDGQRMDQFMNCPDGYLADSGLYKEPNMVYPLMGFIFDNVICHDGCSIREGLGNVNSMKLFNFMLGQISTIFGNSSYLEICPLILQHLFKNYPMQTSDEFTIATETVDLLSDTMVPQDTSFSDPGSSYRTDEVTIVFNHPHSTPQFTDDGVRQTVRKLEGKYMLDTDEIRTYCKSTPLPYGMVSYYDSMIHNMYIINRDRKWYAIVYDGMEGDIALVDITADLLGNSYDDTE